MATIATMAMLKPTAKIVARSAPPSTSGSSNKVPIVSLRSLHKKAGLSAAASVSPSSPAAAAMAGAFFSALASSDAALAAQQVADAAAGDNRGTLLLVVVAPAIGWVLYNILQPALNQLNRMRSGAVVAAGLGGGLAAAGLACAPEASAAQDLVASLAAAAAAAPADDNRGTLLLIVVAPAIAWVLYNILQPALNQLNRMRND